ncbi:DISARM system phospholipase D-like protein DrmC [Deinococcus sp. AJ005]|uniref:DISARM system phospholipase D-like protein DrmC n=1 Tax=Deinococcus sp. AJ005 TaxID=2652443 RepID=UPI00125CCFF7|nr:DISARM system phospholipase D-like protein DrmC [Deinococcus sp. AJ005]QFP75028.1 phospholipase [Deinococcus sp. AJ005]
MKDLRLWRAVAAVVREMPAGHVERLAGRAEGGAVCATPQGASAAERELYVAWSVSDVSPAELASALRAAAVTAEDLRERESIDLVWTGPVTEEVPIRRTEIVLVQLIDGARATLQIVSFVAYEVQSVAAALRRAVGRGVDVVIVLEAPVALGGSLDSDCVTAMRSAVPGAAVYVWNGAGTSGPRGKIHAKCAVADSRTAFVTSANLTGAAMWRNMELGVLVSGGRQPLRLARHLRALVDRRILSPAP